MIKFLTDAALVCLPLPGAPPFAQEELAYAPDSAN
ncbi:hypothetical protein SAMN05216552_102455 [Pseudoduganella namucuonensis]|uniref:Uncharacterized protein n=1 Tax=Pseudoduganella namucuonensis TaxID=1035707 RepID=A0A1I7L7E1_9BURK|nr:hypothetical protein SAMN05216552_102455 [Pseudoduganella namucuonensis]